MLVHLIHIFLAFYFKLKFVKINFLKLKDHLTLINFYLIFMGPHENLVPLITDILIKVKVLLLIFLDLILMQSIITLFEFHPFLRENFLYYFDFIVL